MTEQELIKELLGYFDDFNKAVAARCIAETKYGFSERHGI